MSEVNPMVYQKGQNGLVCNNSNLMLNNIKIL